jgi:crotonobetainyl-CoA:carnitine CoA-transferase CaiB-like acyl-CoA transferase
MTDTIETRGPLQGVRIVDLTSVISGPGAIGLLCDQGADVIKVEPFHGDIMRSRGDVAGFTTGFVSCNRGKRSIALDLKNPDARKILWQMIEQADVLAQNFRPGVIERLGFGANEAMKRNPRLVYLSISGVGQSGPYAKKRVYDPVIQALSGVADIQADPQSGRPRMVRTLVADKTTAVYAAQAVTAALYNREQTGAGQHVRLSMLDTMISYIWPEGMAQHSIIGEEDKATANTAHDMIFPTRDGYVTIGAVSDAEWRALCSAIDRPDLIDDPRFATPGARNTNRQERMEIVEDALHAHSTKNLLEVLESADVPCAPVLTRSEMLRDPQVIANDLIEEIDQPGLGPLRQARAAALFEGTPCAPVRVAPALGEHTETILKEFGFNDADIAELRTSGATK